MTQERLSERIGKKRATIANFLRLLKLPAEVQLGLRDKRLDMGHARALLSIDNPKLQLKLYGEILDQGLSVRRVEELAKEYGNAAAADELTKPKTTERAKAAGEFEQLKRHLSAAFHTRVQFTCNKDGKGKITFPFANDQELERLLALFDSMKATAE